MRRCLVALYFGLAIGAPNLASALPPVCLAELPEWFGRETRVPVGCELIDCCPGCPGDARIDWRVKLTGDVIRSAEIRWQDTDATPVPLRPGESRIASVASARSDGPAALATLRLEPDPAVLERWHAAARDEETPLGEVSIAIDQLIGEEVVNHFRFGASFIDCAAVAAPCDDITQVGNLDGDTSVLLFDARRQAGTDGCSDDRVRRAPVTRSVGNLLTNAGCRSEVGVYSEANAMAMREAVTSWSDACGDQLAVDLAPILKMPATFFLAIPDWVSYLEWGKGIEEVAKEDLANANQIYDQNKAGISFGMDIRHLSGPQTIELLALLPAALLSGLTAGLDPASLVCALPSKLETLGLYVPNRLNVYYLPVPGTGMACADDPNVVFIALNQKPETLAHEFGHGLSLFGTWGHTNTAPGFDSSNLMWVQSSDVRSHISLGQAFRMNLESHSVLNLDLVRSGPTRSCPAEPPPYPDPPACPELRLDWVRP